MAATQVQTAAQPLSPVAVNAWLAPLIVEQLLLVCARVVALKNNLYKARLAPGCTGADPNALDWEVVEINGDSEEVACENLSEAEAHQIAEMWSRKRDEAEESER